MIGYLKHGRNDKGFTLTEMLIAVAVLSLMGLVVIQVFITASSLNHKAADTDRAVAACTTVVEQLKALPADTVLDSRTLAEVLPEALVTVTSNGGEGTLKLLYTSQWEPLTLFSSQSPGYVLEAELKAAGPEDGNITQLNMKVVRQTRYFHKADPKPVIFVLEAALPQQLKGGAVQ